MTSVLVVDDQKRPRELLGRELTEAGFTVIEAHDGEQGWERFCQSEPSIVVTDMSMPRCDGIELLRRIRTRSDVPVIVFSGHGSVESAAEAFKAGADDFVNSLEVEIDDLVGLVQDAAHSRRAPPSDADLETRLVGRSEEITRVRWQLNGLAPLSTSVLVSGEPGTGRSTAIRALHELGTTSGGSLQRIEATDFTRAEFAQTAAIEAVHIAEVQQLDTEGQRFWAERIVRNEMSDRRGRMRMFASTAVDLSSLVRRGAFDPRLGNALLRFEVVMPPLRDRPTDVPDISKSLLRKIGAAVGRKGMQLSPAALKYLEARRFPENFSQLERLLERAVAYSRGRVIRRQTLQELMADLEKSVASMREERQLIERERLLQALREAGGNITHAADILGKSRAAVYRLIEKHDIPLARRS